MSELKSTAPKESDARAEYFRDMYKEQKMGNTVTALVMGLFGTGKTSLIGTGVRPILIDSFDPKGTVVLQRKYADEIESGNIIIRTYWNERSSRPTEYSRWERQWEEDIRTNFLDRFGTYAIDSLTTFLDALSNEVARRKGRSEGQLAIQDYKIIYNTIKDIIKLSSSCDCNFILTAHLVDEKDELTGEITAQMDSYKSMKSQIPLLFTEKWVLLNIQKSKGLEHVLLTEDYKRFRASSQLGSGGVFEAQEEPDLKKLLEKAGFSTEDKPALF